MLGIIQDFCFGFQFRSIYIRLFSPCLYYWLLLTENDLTRRPSGNMQRYMEALPLPTGLVWQGVDTKQDDGEAKK